MKPALFISIAAALAGWPRTSLADEVFFLLEGRMDSDHIVAQAASVSREANGLRITTKPHAERAGVTFTAPKGVWDLAAFEFLLAEVRNLGERPLKLECRVVDSGAGGDGHELSQVGELPPGGSQTLRVPLIARMPEDLQGKLVGMRGYPGGVEPDRGIHLCRVEQMEFFVTHTDASQAFEIANLHVTGQRTDILLKNPEALFPFIDRYGQYLHKNWPGKIHRPKDMNRQARIEAQDLEAHPGPAEWDQYGGWKAGPALPATGRFRVRKHAEKWWFVDPEGRLFWSHGVDCVRPTTAYTPITDREFYFAKLPPKDSELGEFYGRGSWAPHGYYRDKGEYETFNFTAANLWRKYGIPWRRLFDELCHQRLRSWGMNTIGNWSDPEIYSLRQTPYTANVSFSAPPIEGSKGYWGKFPDPFHPDFEANLRQSMDRQKGRAIGDPWCLGYFISNELSWGDEYSLALAALSSPAGQAAKRAFLDDLKAEYPTIEALNAVWDTHYGSWEALLKSTTTPDRTKAGDDLKAFYSRIAEEYFRICRNVLKELDPAGLYLGCRFAWANERAIRAAAEFCDVVSFNKYQRSVADFRFPEGVDKPMLIGEFHFGALDRGMLHTGLVPVPDQQARAEAYKNYLNGALDNRWIVGTHWFQFGDQATTGRGDGENYQIGLLDVCDTPYPETIQAVRKVGNSIYERRLQSP